MMISLSRHLLKQQQQRCITASSSTSSSSSFAYNNCKILLVQQRLQQYYYRTLSSSAAVTTAKDEDDTIKQSSQSSADEEPNTNNKYHLFMWGTDTSGSLWKPKDRINENKIDIPMDITNEYSNYNIKKIVCGPTDTAIITTNGQCYVTGENKQGQLGVGHTKPVTTPTEVTLPKYDDDKEDIKIKDVVLGSNFSAFIDTNNDLYTCGFGGSLVSGMGFLGHGNIESKYTPTLVTSLLEDGCYIQQVTIGESHMTVLTTEGEVLTTGSGSYGRLGNFDTLDQLYLEPVELLSPTMNIIQLAGGKSFTLALTSDGIIYGWGRNHKGQLGTGLGLAVDMYAMQAIPEPIEADELQNRKVIKIAAGHSHAAAITDTGELFFWGMSLYLEPIRITTLLNTKIIDVICGEDYTLVIDIDNNMYSFGKNKTGVVGQGNVKQLNQPTYMEIFDNIINDNKKYKIIQASAGWKHAACLAKEEEIVVNK